MNDRKRQQQKATRMIAMSAKSRVSKQLLSSFTTVIDELADLYYKLGETVLACANALQEAFCSINWQEIAACINQKEEEL